MLLYTCTKKITKGYIMKSVVASVLFISLGAFVVNSFSANASSASEVQPQPIEDIIFDLTEVGCLAKNIYFEAGVEETAGKVAVAMVTVNRVLDEKFPNTICGVVQQGEKTASGDMKRNRCQFSWYCDGKKDTPYQGENWQISQNLAQEIYELHTENKLLDITDGALYYHATYVTPYWAKSMKRTTKIGTHIFYR